MLFKFYFAFDSQGRHCSLFEMVQDGLVLEHYSYRDYLCILFLYIKFTNYLHINLYMSSNNRQH
jgi:hypothetical protein